ncbi:MAG: enoyl-CoA hydratase/isomerase family protein [Halobacteriovoraceae bacterium]|jgi:enoyl-CoA hydratase|nr:enoyl-CoA hydratase/isomerase family protein [Halobacteriovoraceae bacterium]MBT5092980.1 enoyl-CoA hydratase/isomerase family protein [Halobacteriovoraceae bacterium]
MSTRDKFENILFEVKNSIGYLTINREKKLNALNSAVLGELKELLTDLRNELEFDIRGIIFTGAGDKAFIAGADITEMSGMSEKEANAFGKLGQDVSLLFEILQIPVIACVNGFALGGGCEMAMSCDFIYATESAVFGQPEVKLGLIPGYGGTQRLARLVGRNKAKELIYSGRNMKAPEALDSGLAIKLFSTKEEMIAGAEKTMKYILAVSPLAVAHSKAVMNEGNDLTIEQGLACELKHFASVFSSEDMKEGCQAFVEKRAPQFTGR